MPPKVSQSKKPAAPPASAVKGKTAAKPAAKAAGKPAGKAAPAKKAAAGAAAKKVVTKKKSLKDTHAHLFTKSARDFRIGRDIQPKRDVGRFVKWPRYIRLQRQRAILKKRLKIPPPIHAFTNTLDKNQASTLFKLLNNYRPETAEEKQNRLLAAAKAEVKNAETDPAKKPRVLKFGLNHVTTLVEQKKARLVVIAHDVDPIELVVWLPALCRKLDVPHCIVKNKARLGQLVYQKTAAVVALTDIRKEHQHTLDQFVNTIRPTYFENLDRKKWGGGIMGVKAQAVQRLRHKIEVREAAKQLRM